MFKALFGEVKHGQMARLPYLGYSVMLSILMLGFGFAMAYAIGVAEHMLAGNIEIAKEVLRENFSLPFLLLFLLMSVVFLYAGCNIMAKRFRDIGLAGWWMVLAVLVFTGVLSAVVSEQAGNITQTLIWILILLLPGKLLTRDAD